jgi:hypothetical protein
MKYFMITLVDKDGMMAGYKWEIVTNAAIIRSRNSIETKNNAFISMNRHSNKFFQMDVPRVKVRHREEVA